MTFLVNVTFSFIFPVPHYIGYGKKHAPGTEAYN